MSIFKAMNKFEIFAGILLIFAKLFGITASAFVVASISNKTYKSFALVLLSSSGICIITCIVLCLISWKYRSQEIIEENMDG